MSAEFEKTVLTELSSHNKKFDEIDKRFEAVDKRFEDMQKHTDERFDKVMTMLESLRRSVVLIEQKVTVDIPALFDGYTAHQEIQERQQGEINSLNQKVDMHDIRISILEQKTVQ